MGRRARAGRLLCPHAMAYIGEHVWPGWLLQVRNRDEKYRNTEGPLHPSGQVTPASSRPEDGNSQDHRPSSGTQKPAPSVSDSARMGAQVPRVLWGVEAKRCGLQSRGEPSTWNKVQHLSSRRARYGFFPALPDPSWPDGMLGASRGLGPCFSDQRGHRGSEG